MTQPAGTLRTGRRPAGAQPGGMRDGAARDGGTRDGAARDAGGPRDSRRHRSARRLRGPGRWGALQGGLGVCIIVASAVIGAVATMATRSAPGGLLGVLVVAGTVAAALAVRPRAGRMILPVPVLSYLVAALISGFVFNRSAGSSRTALAIAAAQWIANGFFAMVLGTVLAIAITTARWYLWRRAQPANWDPGWQVSAADATWAGPAAADTGPVRPDPGRQPRPASRAPTESRYPGAFTGQGSPRDGGPPGDTGPRGGARAGGTGPRPGPRPGSGPYNFSSGA
jgi:hypothetical protein